MIKNVVVIYGERTLDVALKPGTTTNDLRNQLSIPKEILISKRQGMPFGNDEDIYGQVHEGEKLHATAEATVGAVQEEGHR